MTRSSVPEGKVYTLALNPAIDRTFWVDRIDYDESNRVKQECRYPGGKGIDVSRVLTSLGVPNVAMREHSFLLARPVHDGEAGPLVVLDDGLGHHSPDLHPFSLEHLYDLEQSMGLASTGQTSNANLDSGVHFVTELYNKEQ